MSSLFDLIRPEVRAEREAPVERGLSDEFSQGLRSGGTSAMSQLNTLAGHGMNALGLDGSARLQRAAEGQQEAAQEAVGLTSLDQVDGVRSGLRWAAGAVGQSAPVMAAGLGAAALTGGGAVPALAAGTLATVPFELGDQLQRQDSVAGTERMTSGERLAQALPYAAGSAALQNIVPAGVAARIAGKATPGRIVGRALADVPANAAAEGGAELVRQTGEQGIDPTRTYDLEAAKRAAIEGGALGGALGLTGAVPHALHTAAAQPGAFVGSMKEKAGKLGETLGTQAQSLMGRAKDAAKAVPGAVEGLDLGGKAQAAGQAAQGFVGRAKAAAEGFDLGGKVQSAAEGFDLGGKVQSATEGLDLGGKAQDAAGFVGRQARAAQDAMSGVDLQPMKDKATAAYDSVSKALKGLGDAHTRGRERIKKGEQYFNPESFAGKTEGALRSALDEDSKLRDNAVTKTFQDLWNDHGLDDAQRARLTEFGKNLKDGAAQRGVMVMDELRQQAKGASETLQALAKDFAAKKPEDGTKQSADYSGVNKAVADSISTYVRDYLPHLDNRRGTEELGVALRESVGLMLAGRPVPPSAQARLVSVAGRHTAALLDHVREVTKTSDPKQLDNFYAAAHDLLLAQDQHAELIRAISEQYKGEPLNDSAQSLIAQKMIKWAADSPADGSAHRKFSDAQMMQRLGEHFKDPGKVFDAVDVLVRRKENALAGSPDEAKAAALTEERTARADAADAALAERTQEEGSDTGGEERPGLRKGEARGIDGEVIGIESRPRLRTFREDGQDGMTLSEEFKPGKNGHPSAQAQALAKAQAADPNARWAAADELGPDHPFVKKQTDRLYEQAALEQGLDGKEADAWVQSELKKYGAAVSELPAGHLALEPWEVSRMRVDKGYYNSPSAVKVGDGENVFDAAKIVAAMRKRSAGKENHMPTTGDMAGEQARLFADGIAAIQEHLGKTFEVPDGTVIDATTKLTWGEARKSGLIQSNPAGVGTTKVPWEMREIDVPNDSQITNRVARLEAQRDELVSAAAQARFAELKAKGVFPDKALARVIWKAAREEVSETDAGAKLQRHISRLMREHTQDEAGGVGSDLTNFNPTESGIDMGKLTRSREGVPSNSQTAGVVSPRIRRINELKAELTEVLARNEQLNEQRMDVAELQDPSRVPLAKLRARTQERAIRNEIEILEAQVDSPLGSGKQEFDPFGPTFQEGKGLDKVVPDGIQGGLHSDLKSKIAGELTPPAQPDPRAGKGDVRPSKVIAEHIRRLEDMPPGKGLEGLRRNREIAELTTVLEGRGFRLNREGKWEKVGAKQEGSPDPKAAAAKKAAFLERAASGDEALIGELKASSDVKGLQRAAAALAGAKPKRMGDLMGPLDMGALREGMSDSQWADPLIQEFIQVEDGSMRAELNRDASEWTAEQRKAYDAGHLEKFSRLSGYTDAEIRNWKRSQELTDAIVKKYGNDFAQDLGYGMTVASGQFNARNSGITDALRTVNDRLRALAEDPSNAYAMQTRKYSLERAEGEARVLQFPDRKGERLQAEVQRLVDGLSPEDFHTLQNDVLARDPSERRLPTILREDFREWSHDMYSAAEREDMMSPERLRETEVAFIQEMIDADGFNPAQLAIAKAFISGATLKKFSLMKEHTSSVDEMTVHGKVWDLGDGAKAVEAKRAEFYGDDIPLKGKVYVEWFDGLGDQHSTWVGSLKEARAFLDKAGAKTSDPVRAQAQKSASGDDMFFSRERVDPNATGPRDFKAAADYIRKVLGPKIKVVISNLPHAGEFVAGKLEDLIRLSVHSLNPMSVAFHESLHGFIKNLTQSKGGDMIDVLRKAAESPSVMLALRAKLKGQPEALKQLNDPEERIAYMYQFHQLGENLGLGAPAKGVFGKIAEYFRSILGVWSNDRRALHIMDYFHRGDYAKIKDKPDAVRQALMEPGTNARIEWFKKAAEPLRQLGEVIAVAGHQRLRDTGIPALNELADAIKRQGTSVGGDQGYLPTSRRERVTRMNDFAEGLGDADLRGVLEALQAGDLTSLKTPEERLAARHVRKTLAETKAYMEAAGVEVGDLGPDYFPRVYDLSYISSNKDAFLDVLKTHGITNPEGVMQRLMATEGAEFDVETSRPGMQHLKRRDLAKVPDAALAPFMQKDLMRIVDGYVTQATRRAEWARRFDADGKPNAKFDQLLARARREGASEADLQTATKYMMAVDGTLGDTISPEARRLQGNIMVYQNLRLLPLMIFSSVVDPAGIMVRGGSVGDAWRAFQRGIREIPKGFKKSPTHDDATKFAALIGTIESATLNHALGTSFSQGMVGDTGRAINDKLFKYNLVEQFNTSMRVAATEAAVNFIVKHADGKASPHSARWMAELGLEPGDVQLSPEGKLMASGNIKVAAAINQWVDGAVLRPDAADKPLWMSDPHFALIAHLKQFAFSFQETILKRVAHEAKHGNMAPAYALASYVPIMIAADATKALLTGNDLGDEEWGVEDYVGHGMERAGLLGVGQFPLDASQYGLSSMFGPTVEQLRKAAEVIGGDAEFAPFALKSMPANALYRGAFETGDVAEARFRE